MCFKIDASAVKNKYTSLTCRMPQKKNRLPSLEKSFLFGLPTLWRKSIYFLVTFSRCPQFLNSNTGMLKVSRSWFSLRQRKLWDKRIKAWRRLIWKQIFFFTLLNVYNRLIYLNTRIINQKKKIHFYLLVKEVSDKDDETLIKFCQALQTVEVQMDLDMIFFWTLKLVIDLSKAWKFWCCPKVTLGKTHKCCANYGTRSSWTKGNFKVKLQGK